MYILFFDQLLWRSLISMDTTPPLSRVHHPLYPPQFRKDLSKKKQANKHVCIPVENWALWIWEFHDVLKSFLGIFNLYGPQKSKTFGKKMQAQEEGVFILAFLTEKVLGMAVQISVCQKIFPVVPVIFVSGGTSRPWWVQLNLGYAARLSELLKLRVES